MDYRVTTRLSNTINRRLLPNVEPTTGIEPVNLILTKDALYLLSYVGNKKEK